MSDWNKDRLSSWKEIAAFLGCDVRTCLRWEKERGLPVHRLDGGSRSRVFAQKAELEAWMKGSGSGPASTSADTTRTSADRAPSRPRFKPVLISGISIVVIGLAAILLFGAKALFSDRVPVDFRIEGSKLIIVNREGKFLWEHDTGLETLGLETDFRKLFNQRTRIPGKNERTIPILHIRDIDGDGKNEVLFTPTTSDSFRAGRMICFDHRGRERWRFDGGRELVFGKTTYSRDYHNAFDTLDLDGDGRLEILVLSSHWPEFPSQLTVLSTEGNPLGEYWNSGRILDYLSADLDGDGKKELVISGTNNEFNQGFVAVFDPRKIGGASPNSGEYKNLAFGPGTEKAYIRFPWTDLDPIDSTKSWADNLSIQDNGWIYVNTLANHIIFSLDPKSLECRQVTLTDTFISRHREEAKGGRVSSVLGDAYREKLRTGLLYYTGREWTLTPTWIR